MDRNEIAQALRETGLLLKANGENAFKAKAYIAAARSIQNTDDDIDILIKEARLTELPGIGESLAKFIVELDATGTTKLLTKLRTLLPPGTAELSQIEGMTLKRISALHKALSITTVSELEAACRAGKLAPLKGFGLKVQNDILQTLTGSGKQKDQLRLVKAFEVVADLVKVLKRETSAANIEVAGTVRRWHETIDRITLVADVEPASIAKALRKYRNALSIQEKEDRVEALLIYGVPLEIFCVSDIAFGLIVRTGNEKHFAQLQAQAESQGLVLTPEVLSKGRTQIKPVSERALFKSLGLNFIPPEIREGRGEVAKSKKSDFSNLVQIEDMRGMTHCHTTYSDGVHTIEEMVFAAQKMGMEYVTITDHSPTAHYAGGLTIDRLKEQWEEIDRVQEQVSIKILKGTECDILADGRLDYPDHILEQFDIIIASIHSRYRQDEEKMTKRLLAGLKNPFFKIWGHPLGRITLHRDPIPCNVEKILEAIAGANVAIELNGDPYRMDLPPIWADKARSLGLKFIISTDAHARGDYRNLKYGIHMARRAMIPKSQILNTKSVDAFRKSVQPNVISARRAKLS